MQGLFILLGIGLALAYGLSVLLIVHKMRRPPRRTYASAVAKNLPGDPSEGEPPREFREFTFSHNGRSHPVWEIEGDAPSGPIVIASPGWGDSKISITIRLRAIAPWASAVFAWDPSGLGEAPGKCALGTQRDIDDLMALTRELAQSDDSGEPGPDVVLYGWSLGAGMSIVAAEKLGWHAHAPARACSSSVHLAGVIAESPYRFAPTPTRNYIRLLGLPYRANTPASFWLMGLRLGAGLHWKGFDRAIHASNMQAPLLVVHGECDEIVPIDDGREIATAAPNGELSVIDGAGHNNLWTDEAMAGECERLIGEWWAALPR